MSKAMLETAQLTLGMIPLTDSAPLVVAEAAGFFASEGLDVALDTVRSWAAMRDKLAAGRIEGATLLAPMPLAAAFGLDPVATPILTVKALSQGGSAFCVTPELHARLCEHGASDQATPLEWAQAMRRLVEAERGTRPAPTLAHVYPYSTHHYELRYWLASVGLHPELDLNLVTVPPPLMVQQLEAGRIDGAWVGSPWPALAAARGVARVLFDKRQFWNGGPEKVFAVTQPWAEAHPATLAALLRALIAAGRWLEQRGQSPAGCCLAAKHADAGCLSNPARQRAEDSALSRGSGRLPLALAQPLALGANAPLATPAACRRSRTRRRQLPSRPLPQRRARIGRAAADHRREARRRARGRLCAAGRVRRADIAGRPDHGRCAL